MYLGLNYGHMHTNMYKATNMYIALVKRYDAVITEMPIKPEYWLIG